MLRLYNYTAKGTKLRSQPCPEAMEEGHLTKWNGV